MTDCLAALQSLHRPRLLVSAARFGLEHYRRGTALRRLLGTDAAPAPRVALERLRALEAEQDADRRARAASYSPARHVEILIALMAEARLVARTAARTPAPATRRPEIRPAAARRDAGQPKASGIAALRRAT